MGWQLPADIVGGAFERVDVVMMNEGHSGLARCARTRRVGQSVLPAAHARGCRYLAMEALPNPAGGFALSRELPSPSFGYLAQPEMVDFVAAALAFGWTLVAYEAQIDMERVRAARPETIDDVNDRERQQAEHLVAAKDALGADARMLVWCGNGHGLKRRVQDWVPMGVRFAELAGHEAFSIDQLATVSFDDDHRPQIPMTADLEATLTSFGGTAGYTADDVPDGYPVPYGYDALVLSTDNTMVGV